MVEATITLYCKSTGKITTKHLTTPVRLNRPTYFPRVVEILSKRFAKTERKALLAYCAIFIGLRIVSQQ